MSSAQIAQAVPVEPAPTSSLYMIALLGIVSTVCGLVIVLAYEVTKPAIKRNLNQITRDAVFDILPEARDMTTYAVHPSGELEKLADIEGSLPKLYACFDGNGQLAGVVCEAAGAGYAGVIKVLYAYNPGKECITGFSVLESAETPGLGDKIAKDEGFLANFKDLDARLDASGSQLAHMIEGVKSGSKSERWQIDGISGATVSSRAVGVLLNRSANDMIPLIVRELAQLKEGG